MSGDFDELMRIRERAIAEAKRKLEQERVKLIAAAVALAPDPDNAQALVEHERAAIRYTEALAELRRREG